MSLLGVMQIIMLDGNCPRQLHGWSRVRWHVRPLCRNSRQQQSQEQL